MTRLVLLLVMLAAVMRVEGGEPEVSNVCAAQRPGRMLVDITYDLKCAAGAKALIGVALWVDGGETYGALSNGLTGAVGGTIWPGLNKRVEWEPGLEWLGRSNVGLRFRVIAYGYPTSEAPWTNSLGMRLVPVSGTEVLFCVWETRVQDYRAFVEATGRRWEKLWFEQGATHPAVNVSWEDGEAFCAWLTAKERGEERLLTNQVYRLPTDWEWSMAVRCGPSPGSCHWSRPGLSRRD